MTAALVIGVAVSGVALLIWLRSRYVVVAVEGSSMRPTVTAGDRVLVRKMARSAAMLRTGQVVVLEHPTPRGNRTGWVWPSGQARSPRWLIKRVVAVAGETVPEQSRRRAPAGLGETVPHGHVTVLGDNVDDSLDSRHIGHVPVDRILGVVLRRLSS